MPLRQDKAVVLFVARIPRVESHLSEEQRRHDLGGRAATSGMPATGLARGTDRFDPKSGRDIAERG